MCICAKQENASFMFCFHTNNKGCRFVLLWRRHTKPVTAVFQANRYLYMMSMDPKVAYKQ